MSKILKITMILVMAIFAVFITPQERASANPLAVGGALYLGGAGVYVVGATIVGAIAAIGGCTSCQEDIEAHAQRTWDGSTQLAKDGLQLMIDAAVGTGTALTATDSRFNTWMDSQVGNMALAISSGTITHGIITSDWAVTKATASQAALNAMAEGSQKIFSTIDPTQRFNTIVINASSSYLQIGSDLVYYYSDADARYTRAQIIEKLALVTTAEQWMALANELSLKYSYSSIDNNLTTTSYAAAVSSVKEAWEDMRDAGLVLPVDNARPMYNNQPVTYDPTTDSYAGIDGIAVPRDGITFDFQKPNWKTLDDLATLGLAGLGAGLYIDGWAGSDSVTSTYNPTTDTTTTTTSGTTTNVTTGETAVTSTTTTTTGDTTGNPPIETPTTTTPKTPTANANRWGKLVTTKFPFSLPWDLFFILSFMNAEPVSPVFEVDERILKRENVEGIQIKFSIDLSFLDPYVPWFRRLIVLGFAFFLVMNTRKLLGGAQ